jgi:hypothetical protein
VTDSNYLNAYTIEEITLEKPPLTVIKYFIRLIIDEFIHLIDHIFSLLGFGDLRFSIKFMIFTILCVFPCIILSIGFFIMGSDSDEDLKLIE